MKYNSLPVRLLLVLLLSGCEGCPWTNIWGEEETTAEGSLSESGSGTGLPDIPDDRGLAPRITHVMAEWISAVGTSEAKVKLHVQGANIEDGSEILVGGSALTTTFERALTTGVADAMAATLKYPVYYYAMVGGETTATIGAPMSITVRNPSGLTSNTLSWSAPTEDQWDTDGDGSLDSWERDGYKGAGATVLCDLPGLGADPRHFDVFVEVDHMGSSTAEPTAKKPTDEAWLPIVQALASSPFLNLDDIDGVHLHVDHGAGTYLAADGSTLTIPAGEMKGGEPLERHTYIRYDDLTPSWDPSGDTENFYALKTGHFDSDARRPIFHYCIFADRHGEEQDATGRAEIPGNDFFITLLDYDLTDPGRVTGVFLHELAHNLGLAHGGDDEERMEPNHLSVLSAYKNYFIAGIDNDCDGVPDGVFDLSLGTQNDLDENGLLETGGMCGGVDIDWNGDGTIQTSGYSYDMSSTSRGAPTVYSVLNDYDDWGHTIFNFRNSEYYDD